jgi:hypothetical protein
MLEKPAGIKTHEKSRSHFVSSITTTQTIETRKPPSQYFSLHNVSLADDRRREDHEIIFFPCQDEKQITIFLSISNLDFTHSLHNKSSSHETENSMLIWFKFHCKFFESETGKFEEV